MKQKTKRARRSKTAIERAAVEAVNGNADRLHEILRREKTTLGSAYRAISDVYDRIDESDPNNDADITDLFNAMAALRRMVIDSELPCHRSDR